MNDVSLLFFIKRTKSGKREAKAPLYLKLSQSALSVEISTGIAICPTLWDVKNKKILGSSKEVEEQNDHLSVIRVEIRKVIKKLQKNGQQLSPQLIKKTYKSEHDLENHLAVTLIDIFDDFLVRQEKRVGKTFAPRSYDYFVLAKSFLVKYLAHLNKPNILPVNFTSKIAMDMQYWLLSDKRGQATVNKIMQHVRKVLKHAVVLEVILFNPMEALDLRIKPTFNLTSLEKSELDVLEAAEITNNKIRCMADLYIFQAHTGLCYIDTQTFDAKKDLKTVDGMLCIEKLREKNRFRKTKPDTFVPVDEKAYEILVKYDFVLPKTSISNYRLNLFKIAKDVLHTDKHITSHTGRKTFGNISINHHKIPLEITSIMLGHSSPEITFKMYARPKETTILHAMEGLKLVHRNG